MTTKFFQTLHCVLITYGLVDLGTSSSTIKMYYPAAISSDDLLNTTSPEVLTNISRIICATKASQTETYHLFCYENQLCSLYDVTVPRRSGPNIEEFLKNCWTDKNNTEDDKIISTTTTVTATSLTTATATSLTTAAVEINPGCGQGFTDVPGVGSLCFIEIQMTMSSAENACSSYNAKLVAPLIFETLRLYVTGLQEKGTAYWLGIKNGFWLDGRPVLELTLSILTGVPGCAYMDGGRTYNLYGTDCTSTMGSICQLN